MLHGEGIHLSGKLKFPKLSYSLTFFVATDHSVSLVSGKIPDCSQAKVILGPLNGALLIENSAWKCHPAANHCGLIHRLDGESLINYFRRCKRLQRRRYHGRRVRHVRSCHCLRLHCHQQREANY